MKKISLIIVLIATCMLTACSFIPKRSNAETAEKYAQKYINEQVSLSDKKSESQKDSYQMRTIYHLKDDRNIEFNVMVDDNYISFVEASIPNIYTNYTIFSSDYKARVMEYYFEDIDEKIDYFNKLTVADKIVGKASAMLLCLSGVKEVHCIVLSKAGKDILEKYGVTYKYEQLVDYIINRTGDDMCPMEKTVKDIDDLNKAYVALNDKLKQLSKNKG